MGQGGNWQVLGQGLWEGSASRAAMAKEHSQGLLVLLPSCWTDAATGCWVLWEEWVLHMDQLTWDSSRVEFCPGIAGSEPCVGQEGSALGFGRTHGMVNDSCAVWTQIQMLIPKLLPKTCQVFGSGVLAWSHPAYFEFFFFFFCCCKFGIGNASCSQSSGLRQWVDGIRVFQCWVGLASAHSMPSGAPRKDRPHPEAAKAFSTLEVKCCHPQQQKCHRADGC